MRFQPCQSAVSPKSGLPSWLTITLVLHLSQHRSTYQSHGPTSRVDDSWCKQPWPIPIRARMALLVSDRVGRILNTNLMYQSYIKMWIDRKRKGKLNYELITQGETTHTSSQRQKRRGSSMKKSCLELFCDSQPTKRT